MPTKSTVTARAHISRMNQECIMQRRRYNAIHVILVLAIVSLPIIYVWVSLGYWPFIPARPLFYNHYVSSDKEGFGCYWSRESSSQDRQGNYAFADYHENMLVVFITNNDVDHFPWGPRSTPTQAAFMIGQAGNLEVKVDLKPNVLIVFGRDQSRRDFPLGEAEAERLLDELWSGFKSSKFHLPTALVKPYRGTAQEQDALSDWLEKVQAP